MFGCWFRFLEPIGSWLVGSVGCLWSPYPLWVPQSSPKLFHKTSSSLLMFGCESLHLLQIAAGWSLSEDSYARYQTASISLIVSGIGTCPWNGSHFVPATVWPFHSLYAIFISEFLVGWKIFGWRFCGWLGVLNLPLGVLPNHMKQLLQLASLTARNLS